MIIKDKNLEPYHVYYDGYSYQLNENKESKKDGIIRTKTHGYYTNLPNALLKAIEYKAGSRDYNSISEYIEQLNKNKESILNILN